MDKPPRVRILEYLFPLNSLCNHDRRNSFGAFWAGPCQTSGGSNGLTNLSTTSRTILIRETYYLVDMNKTRQIKFCLRASDAKKV